MLCLIHFFYCTFNNRHILRTRDRMIPYLSTTAFQCRFHKNHPNEEVINEILKMFNPKGNTRKQCLDD